MAHTTDTDPVLMTLVNNYLNTTTLEMGLTMARTAYSPIFNETWDFSCGVFDAKGEMLSQGEFCPAQTAALQFALEWIIKEKGIDSFGPQDFYLHNDPYRGMNHLPEHAVFKAVYHRSELIGFTSTIGHMAEVGGMAPGGFPPDAVEVFQEGLRIPPTKIIKNGREDEEIWQLISANVRTPRKNIGDIRAMIGACRAGEKRLIELVDSYGLEEYRRICESLKTYAEQRMREEIRAMPQGVYEDEEYLMDNDGIEDRPFRVKVRITIMDGKAVVDYTGSEQQARGPINCTYVATAAATYNAFMQITPLDIPSNKGRYRPIELIIPPGLLNVQYPGASVIGNTELHPHIVMLIFRALSGVIPEKVAAADNGTCALIGFGGVHPRTREIFADMNTEAMGHGARLTSDGNDARTLINGNTRITSVEVIETRFPFLHHRYCLNTDSGGAGRTRGGLGTIREVEILAEELRLSACVEREKLQPWGLLGGRPGKNSGILVKLRGAKSYRTFKDAFGTKCNAKFSNVVLRKGDRIIIFTGGGGGYGNPEEREPEKITEDLREGYLSEKEVLRAYPQYRRLNRRKK
jgi:N-methylhydantoinase B